MSKSILPNQYRPCAYLIHSSDSLFGLLLIRKCKNVDENKAITGGRGKSHVHFPGTGLSTHPFSMTLEVINQS